MTGPTDAALVTQAIAEVLANRQSYARVTQLNSPAMVHTASQSRASQINAPRMVHTKSDARASQIVLLVLCYGFPKPMVAIFPTLKGLTFSTIKRPIFSTNTGEHVSGNQVRLGMWSNPKWEWDLQWDFLPDDGASFTGSNASDLKTLMGFYLFVQGSLMTFAYQDPDDFSTIASQCGIGDGTTTTFTFHRTFGGSDGQATEPIGFLWTSQAYSVLVNGSVVDPSAYTVNTDTPYNQTVTFGTAPASDAVVAWTGDFYYSVHFKDDQYDFEKWAYRLWIQKKITLESTRS